MPCCGKKRIQARRTKQAQQAPTPMEATSSRLRPERDSVPYFQYLGETGLTVIGPRSHKLYRFNHPGTVVAVDPRDWSTLAAVSLLKQVSEPTDAANEFQALE